MNINQLEYFVAIAEHDNFLDAADSLHLSQSSLSKSVQRLEEELGVKLLDRSRRKAVLTQEGKVFYKGSLKTLAAHKKTIENLNIQKREKIRLVTLPILSLYNITEKLMAFANAYPDIELIIEEMEDASIIRELREDTCDLAITRKEIIDNAQFKNKFTNDFASKITYFPLETDSIEVILNKSHPLSKRRSINLKELANENFILMNKHLSIYHSCVEACKNSGFSPKVIRTARVESILSAVRAGEGISMLMKRNIDVFNHDGLSIVPLEKPIYSTVVTALPLTKYPNKNVRNLIENYIFDNIPIATQHQECE